MGNLINIPNINPATLEVALNSNEKVETKSGFDAKNYLNVRLAEGETEKKLVIRLLPMNLETGEAFVTVHTHNVKVPKDVSPSGYKSYICLRQTKGIDHSKYGNKCPFCELNRMAYEKSTQATDPIEKKKWQEISIANIPRETIILRCIERGKEAEGVKFWKFNTRLDKTDPYNTILNLYNERRAEARQQGSDMNILDIYEGVDLNVTITNAKNSAPRITAQTFKQPVTKDQEKLKEWIFDKKTWQDVFSIKPYDYLSLIVDMKTPWFDRETGKWVDKEEYTASKENKESENKNKVEKATKDILTGASVTPSVTVSDGTNKVGTIPYTPNAAPVQDAYSANPSGDDDLPY